MVRFKNRYLLFELVWKDGKLDDGISEQRQASGTTACAALLGAAAASWDGGSAAVLRGEPDGSFDAMHVLAPIVT